VDKITQYGAELAMLLRREEAHRLELLTCGERIEELTKLILAEAPGTLYGTTTTDPPTERVTLRRAATGELIMPAHVALRKNSDPVPLRADHLDGGNTFRLNPIADTLTSGTIARIVECPDNCGISSGHVHTADGEIHPTSVH
jgi:hypothetical protein